MQAAASSIQPALIHNYDLVEVAAISERRKPRPSGDSNVGPSTTSGTGYEYSVLQAHTRSEGLFSSGDKSTSTSGVGTISLGTVLDDVFQRRTSYSSVVSAQGADSTRQPTRSWKEERGRKDGCFFSLFRLGGPNQRMEKGREEIVCGTTGRDRVLSAHRLDRLQNRNRYEAVGNHQRKKPSVRTSGTELHREVRRAASTDRR